MYSILLYTDSPDGWILPYLKDLEKQITHQFSQKYSVTLVTDLHTLQQQSPQELLFLLGCTKITPKDILDKNQHNLVLHESALPQGKGWSPLSWQILEGKNEIPICLIEAEEKVDSGAIYLQDAIHLQGTELYEELKAIQGQKTIELVLKFLDQYPKLQGSPQVGEESFYPKRTTKDDQLDPNKPLKELFDALRIANANSFPAWFEHRGKRYSLFIQDLDNSQL